MAAEVEVASTSAATTTIAGATANSLDATLKALLCQGFFLVCKQKSSATAQKLQQRPKKLEEANDEFPDALKLIPTRDAQNAMQDHAAGAARTGKRLIETKGIE
jgi:hypothetical protein